MSIDKFGKKFDRLYAAVVTPYKDDYEVDEAALRKLLKYFMKQNFIESNGGIIINSGAGEAYYLSRQEKKRNVEIAVEECGGKVPVFAGVVDLRTENAVKVAIDAKDTGADGLFLIPPIGIMDVTVSWNPEKYPEVWVDMAKAEVEAVDLPAIAFPITAAAGPFGPGLPVESTIKMCEEIPNIIGWKIVYTYENARKITRALRALDRHVGIFIPGANLFHEYLANAYFDGALSGGFNYAMEPMIDHINAWNARDIDEACKIWQSGLSELHDYVYSEFSRLHTKYKAACWLRGLIPIPFCRPPMQKPTKQDISILRDLLKKAGLDVIPDSEINRTMIQLRP